MRHHGILIALTAAAGLLGCARKDAGSVQRDTVPAATPVAAGPNVVVVHAKDFAYTAPAQVPAGMTTFRLINEGPNLHHLAIVRLDSAHTFADLQQALARPGAFPRWAAPVGGPNAPEAGGESNATLDLTAGNYALVCFVDMPGGVPHFAKGMAQPLTVTAATGIAAAAPASDLTVTLNDYSFGLSGPVVAGTHTFKVLNAARQPHEIQLVRLAPGKTMDDFILWLKKRGPGQPGAAVGGIAGTLPGTTSYFSADMTPGDYVLVCFLPDMKDGKPHFMKGMVQPVKVS